MQLKLQLPGVVLELPPRVWNQLDPEAQKAVVQALARTTIKAISHKSTDQRNENQDEVKDERQN
jgi:TRAP-type C4-dicarboxylate transport system substrate-binding protein